MKNYNTKIASVIVLYNPEINVVKNILSCIEQSDILYIIDNSETPFNLDKIISGISGRVEYLFLNGNKGVAYALNLAARMALENNYKFLLTMDQDSYLPIGGINNLINSVQDIEKAGIISPLHRNKFNTQVAKENKSIEEVLFVKTSGNLLNLDIYHKVGPFDENLFIDYVDIEYGMRLNRSGYKVIRVNSVLMEHNEGNLIQKNLFLFKIYTWNHKPERWFYKIRNLFYLQKHFGKYYPSFFSAEKFNYLKQIIKVIFYEKEKIKKIRYAIYGYIAYKKNLTGKIPDKYEYKY